MAKQPRPLLVHITTVPQSLYAFFHGQIAYVRDAGFEVEAISSPGELLQRFADREGISVHAIEMPRAITPLQDVKAVVRLAGLLRRLRPCIVHAHTPKGGLLGILAATLAQVPVRIYQVHGLPCMTATGLRRTALRAGERVACLLSHRVLYVSDSLLDHAKSCGLASSKATVIHRGSINGVDSDGVFDRHRYDVVKTKQSIGLPADGRVLGFVGRVTRDKGIEELLVAWRSLRERYGNLSLLIVGGQESEDPIGARARHDLATDPRVFCTGWVLEPAPCFAVMDVLAFPSHREGFGLAAIEAAAMRIPVVASDIPGCRDAVKDGVTGTLVPPGEPEALARALGRYLDDPSLARAHGDAGVARVRRDFQPRDIWQALVSEYATLLGQKHPAPDV